MGKLVKSGIDVIESILINLKLNEILDTDFWQELLITLFVIFMNFLILPSLKKLWNLTMNWLIKKKILKVGDKEMIESYLKEHNCTLEEISYEDAKELWKEIKNKCQK